MTDATYGDYSTVALALEFADGVVGTMLGSYDTLLRLPRLASSSRSTAPPVA